MFLLRMALIASAFELPGTVQNMLSVAITCFAGYLLSCFGFIHSASLGFYPLSVFGIGYLIVAVLALIYV